MANPVKKEKWTTFVERITELLKNSSVHGIPKLFKSNNKLLAKMWLVLIIISTCICSRYVITNILDFLKYNTVTSINFIHERQSPFPAITICSYPFTDANVNETIEIVKFDRISVKTNFSSLFKDIDDPYYGKCFRYNTGKNNFGEKIEIKNSTRGGKSNGLKLRISLEIPAGYDYSELLLSIHNQSSPPFELFNSGFWMRPGSWNYFEVERVLNERLSYPYSDCLNDPEEFSLNKTLINYFINTSRIYSQIDCYYICSQFYALQESKCGCISNLTNFDKDCHYGETNSTLKDCISNYLSDFRKYLQYDKCFEYCPLECKSMSYSISSYSEYYPATGIIGNKTKEENHFEKYKTYEELNQNLIIIYVYYKELKYTLINQQPKTETFDFISKIGGIFGLFLGISFMSFIEILEILFEIINIFRI